MNSFGSAILATLTLSAAAHAGTPYEDWAAKNAKAAKELAKLVEHTPGGAKELGKWVATKPDEAKQIGELMKAQPDVSFSDAASKLKLFGFMGVLVEAGFFSESLEKWFHHNADAAFALFTNPEAMKVAMTPPEGARGSLFGALTDAAPPGRESDEMYEKYKMIGKKELPARGGLDGKLGAQYHDLAAGEYSDQDGSEVLKTWVYGTGWDITVDALNNNMPRHRNVKGITIIRKDKTKCMVFFDSLSQEWTSRDLAGNDHYDSPCQYSMDDRGRFKIPCSAVK